LQYIRGEPLAQLQSDVNDWLYSAPKGDEGFIYFSADGGLPDSPFLYFRDGLGLAFPETLGVVVIEGEFPGSTYYAAELTISTEEANRRAETSGLPVRFIDEAP
jgi:hypothetical protein